jgi:hypothetical protein
LFYERAAPTSTPGGSCQSWLALSIKSAKLELRCLVEIRRRGSYVRRPCVPAVRPPLGAALSREAAERPPRGAARCTGAVSQARYRWQHRERGHAGALQKVATVHHIRPPCRMGDPWRSTPIARSRRPVVGSSSHPRVRRDDSRASVGAGGRRVVGDANQPSARGELPFRRLHESGRLREPVGLRRQRRGHPASREIQSAGPYH